MAADGAPRPNASCHPLSNKVQVRARPSRFIDKLRISLALEAPPVCTMALSVSSGSANAQYYANKTRDGDNVREDCAETKEYNHQRNSNKIMSKQITRLTPQPAHAPAARNVALDSRPPKCGPRHRLPNSFMTKNPPHPKESRRTVTPVPLQRPNIPSLLSVWRMMSMGVFILRRMASLLVPSAVDTREWRAIC